MSTCANWAMGVTRKKMKYSETRGQRSVLALPPNAAKSLPQDRVLSDKSGQLSLSFIPIDAPSPRRERLREQRAWQPYLAALRIAEAPSDLSDLLCCLLADSSTDACRSLVGTEAREGSCSASAANVNQRPRLTGPTRQVCLFVLVKIIPIKANLSALYAFLIKADVCLF